MTSIVFHIMRCDLILALLCLSTISQGADLTAFSKSTSNFAVDLLKAICESSKENVAFSSNSINILLSVLQQGANGKTAELLASVLHSDSENSKAGFSQFLKPSPSSSKDSGVLKTGTRMYVKKGFEVNPKFTEIAKTSFGTVVDQLDEDVAAAAQIINQWVANSTDNFIPSIIQPESLSSDTVMVLLNAIYFNGKWMQPFFSSNLNENFFYAPSESVKVPFIKGSRRLNSGREPDLGFKWVEIPYESEEYSMILIMPHKNKTHKLNEIISAFSGDALLNIMNTQAMNQVRLRFPKFTIKTKTPLKEALNKMNLGTLFTDAADLSGMGQGIKLSSIEHKAVLEVDEKGSKAAASTGLIINTLSLSWTPEEIIFNAKEPFIFFIVNRARKIPLFAGRVTRPI